PAGRESVPASLRSPRPPAAAGQRNSSRRTARTPHTPALRADAAPAPNHLTGPASLAAALPAPLALAPAAPSARLPPARRTIDIPCAPWAYAGAPRTARSAVR